MNFLLEFTEINIIYCNLLKLISYNLLSILYEVEYLALNLIAPK